MWVEKGNLTSARNAMPESHFYGNKFGTAAPLVTFNDASDHRSVKNISLTVAPAALQINVLHNGQPVVDALVQLYFSQEAYEQEVPAQADSEQVKSTYGYSKEYPESYIDDLSMFFLAHTTQQGEAYFPNLEPKRYWFKVTKNGMSNSSGTISIEQPLNNATYATRVITVGIN